MTISSVDDLRALIREVPDFPKPGIRFYDITTLLKDAEAFREVTVVAERADGGTQRFHATVRIDTPQEIRYYQNGGILPYVLRQLISGKAESPAPGGVSSVGDSRTGSVPT